MQLYLLPRIVRLSLIKVLSMKLCLPFWMQRCNCMFVINLRLHRSLVLHTLGQIVWMQISGFRMSVVAAPLRFSIPLPLCTRVLFAFRVRVVQSWLHSPH